MIIIFPEINQQYWKILMSLYSYNERCFAFAHFNIACHRRTLLSQSIHNRRVLRSYRLIDYEMFGTLLKVFKSCRIIDSFRESLKRAANNNRAKFRARVSPSRKYIFVSFNRFQRLSHCHNQLYVGRSDFCARFIDRWINSLIISFLSNERIENLTN